MKRAKLRMMLVNYMRGISIIVYQVQSLVCFVQRVKLDN